MKTMQGVFTAIVAVLAVWMQCAEGNDKNVVRAQHAIELFSVSPELFTENQGQWKDSSVRYMHRGNGATVALTDAGTVFHLYRQEQAADSNGAADMRGSSDRLEGDDCCGQPPLDGFVTHTLSFSASFVGARDVQPVGVKRSQTVFNYVSGSDRSRWRMNVPNYEKVVYRNLYEGIDLHTWGRRSSLKYEFHVAPGADYKQILVRYEGVAGLSANEDGSLNINFGSGWGSLTDDAPYVYQEIDGMRIEVSARFVLIDEFTYGFEITGGYDSNCELIIDPDVAWSTYLGGSHREFAYSIASDESGNAFVTGYTTSRDFEGALNSRTGHEDMFVAKVSTGGTLLWATYVGAEYGSSQGYCITVDAQGDILLGGFTTASDFPGALNTQIGGVYDAIVVKMSSDGSVIWSAYLGGSGTWDFGKGIVSDESGNIYLAGSTDSRDFVGAINSFSVDHDAFVAKLSANGVLQWARLLGGDYYDSTGGIALDSSGNTLIAGTTSSSDFPAANNAYKGGQDAFVAKISAEGQLLYSTYLGGSGDERCRGVCVDSSGNAMLMGVTKSTDFEGRNNNYIGPYWDTFVAKVSPAGSVVWATYLEGSVVAASLAGTAIDGLGNTIICIEERAACISPEGILQWSTILGGSASRQAFSIVDTSRGLMVAGSTQADDLPAANNERKGSSDAFIMKLITQKNTLSVRTEPAAAVDITGDAPGITNYTAIIQHGDTIALEAPDEIILNAVRYVFVRWMLNAEEQPDGQTSLLFTMVQDSHAVAVYEVMTHTLAVYSAPVDQVSITGDVPGNTDYEVTLNDMQTVALSAPERIVHDTGHYVFDRWQVSGETFAAAGIPILMDRDVTAVAHYRLLDHSLAINSLPFGGIRIAGDVPGETPYSAGASDGSTLLLIAPEAVSVNEVEYSFTWWMVDGAVRRAGENTLLLNIQNDSDLMALYQPAGMFALQVQSVPVSGVAIRGNKPGVSTYTVACGQDEEIQLSAPSVVRSGDTPYIFRNWNVDGNDQPLHQTDLCVTMDSSKVVTSCWSIRADIDEDDTVDLQDLVHVRNQLGDQFEPDIYPHPCPTLNPAPIAVTDSQVMIFLNSRGVPDNPADVVNVKLNGTTVLNRISLNKWSLTDFLDLKANVYNTIEIEYVQGGSNRCISADVILELLPSGNQQCASVRVAEPPGNTAAWKVFYEKPTYKLAVQSTPAAGIAITGTKPGKTNYSVTCVENELVTLVAPETVHNAGVFSEWQIGEQCYQTPEISIVIDSDTTCVARYSLTQMTRIPAGTFTTSTGVDVYLDEYEIDIYEVTNDLYLQFLNSGGKDNHWRTEMKNEIARNGNPGDCIYSIKPGMGRRPVRYVTWYDAVAFCNWRSKMERVPQGTFHLPTEAQWEKAAGWDPEAVRLWNYGTRTDTLTPEQANYEENIGTTTDVGSYHPSRSYYGLYDASGNVREWCYDWGGTSIDYPSTTLNPTGPPTGTSKVCRGGAWLSYLNSCRVGQRGFGNPDVPSICVGFRCARILD